MVNNLLTIDLEDWFHICGVEDVLPPSACSRLESRVEVNTRKILGLFRQFDVKATVFVLGYIAEHHPDLIQEIEQEGHEIASHGYSHRRVYDMTPQQFRADLKRSLHIISGITGKPVRGFRAPEWSIRDDSLWALDVLAQEGFHYDSSMAPLPVIGDPRYQRVPHKRSLSVGSLWEIPPLVGVTPLVNLPLGGGWGLRCFPYWLIRRTIHALNREGHPALIFLHPREFDRFRPPVHLPWIKRFVVSGGVVHTEQRIKRLLTEYTFTTVADFLETKKRHCI